ncbi:MAG TPA: sugar transferase [Solirubrobacteraceae bacterium]|nr:sugar transferase [Solirubrobacteraceae bacterium]
MVVSSEAFDPRMGALEADGIAPTMALPAREGLLLDASCRALDIAVSAVLLLVLLPVFAAIGLLIRLDSPGPVLFRQQRIGRGRVPFTANKFRTMQHGAAHDRHREFVLGLIHGKHPAPEDSSTPYYKMMGDPRVTTFGRLLRRSSLDELPQLWNVLWGQMSLVGPRPPIPYEVEHYPAHWFDRFAVKPGITGLWQVSGRSEVALEDMVRLDVEYAHRRSLALNLWILLRTLPAVLGAKGAW